MKNNIKLKLHKIKCHQKQEIYRDEIILCGVMVSDNDLFQVTPLIPERKFWNGSVYNFDTPLDLIVISLDPLELSSSKFNTKAAIWIVERDNSQEYLWNNNVYTRFSTMYNQKLVELNNRNPDTKNAIEAFNTILPEYHQYILDSTTDSDLISDSDEVFPYIETEFSYSGNALQAPHSQTTRVTEYIKEYSGGEAKYQLNLSWSFEIENSNNGANDLNPNDRNAPEFNPHSGNII